MKTKKEIIQMLKHHQELLKKAQDEHVPGEWSESENIAYHNGWINSLEWMLEKNN